jgi:hypothetical protein
MPRCRERESHLPPRRVDEVRLGRDGDLVTSCGVHIGSSRADVELAYRDAIASWDRGYAFADHDGFVNGPSPSFNGIMLASADGALIGAMTLERDRVVQLDLLSSWVLYVGQW